MSISDRLRTVNMRAAMTASPSSMSSQDTEGGCSESSDARRMNAALEELRSYCRTEAALKSFEAFEAQLRKKTNTPARPIRAQTVDTGSDFSDEDADRILRARLKTQHALQSRLTPVTAKRVSRIPTPVTLEPPLPNIFSRLTLTKSKTTGNLATLSTFGFPSLSASKVSLPPTSHSLGAKATEFTQHVRRKSGLSTTQNANMDALKEREQKVKQRAAEAQRRTSTRTTSIGSTNSSGSALYMEANNSKPTKKSHLRQSSTTTSLPHVCCNESYVKVSRDVHIAEGMSVGAVEAGHHYRPPPPPEPLGSPDVEMTQKGIRSEWNAEVKMLGAEKVIRSKSRWRPERRSSGEVVKSFFDAGMSQVKKMGKRVGGSMSWAGSAEDLNVMVSGHGEK